MEGEVNATQPGPPCPQNIGQTLVGSEDCLFLNVYSPEVQRDLIHVTYQLWDIKVNADKR